MRLLGAVAGDRITSPKRRLSVSNSCQKLSHSSLPALAPLSWAKAVGLGVALATTFLLVAIGLGALTVALARAAGAENPLSCPDASLNTATVLTRSCA